MKSLLLKISLLVTPVFILFIGCVDSLTSTDKLPPFIAVYSPKTNDTIAYRKVKINYSANDDQEIKFLELFVNDSFKEHYNVRNGVLPQMFIETDSTFINSSISYYIKIYDAANNVSTSNIMSGIFITEDRNPPNKPFNLQVTVLSSTSIKLSWDDSSSNESAFIIMKKESGGSYSNLGSVGRNISYYIDSGLDSNKIYYYQVQATNKYGTSDLSNEVNSKGIGLLNAPTELRGIPLSMSQIKLTWKDNSTEEQKFMIQRKGIGDTYFNEVGSVDANTSEYLDKGLWGGTSYNYRIAAQKDTSKSWSAIITVTTMNENVNPPSNLSSNYDSINQVVKLTWVNNTPSAILTRVERKEVMPGAEYLQIDSVSTGITNFSDYKIEMGKNYSYRVRVFTSGNNVSGYSNTTTLQIPVYPPKAPSELNLNLFSNTFFNLSWQDNSNDEDGFEIWRRDGYSGQFLLLKKTAANVHTDNDQVTVGNMVYFYKVCSYRIYNNNTLRSDFSNIRNSYGGTSEYPNPTQLKDSALCPSKIKLSWIDNTFDELGFKLERKTEWGVYSSLTLLPPNTQSFIDNNGINPGTKYFYRIQVFNGNSNSDWIEFSAVTTPSTGTCP